MASILILVPALCIAIVYIIYVLRHSYKPEPIRFVGSSESYRSSRCWCLIHESYFGHLGATCPMCEGDYNNDVIAGIYPPGINENNKEFYYVEDWIALRKIDLLWKEGKITEQEAIRKRDEYITDTILKRVAVATGTDPEIQRAKIEANQKRLHDYAGAAQYSGITTPK